MKKSLEPEFKKKAGKHTCVHQLNSRKLLVVFNSAVNAELQLCSQF
jgi:hypothetical protein